MDWQAVEIPEWDRFLEGRDKLLKLGCPSALIDQLDDAEPTIGLPFMEQLLKADRATFLTLGVWSAAWRTCSRPMRGFTAPRTP